jgi:hypothetical protein
MSELNNCIKPFNENDTNNIFEKKEKKEKKELSTKEIDKIDYKFFYKNNVFLLKLKLDELKYIAKKFSLKFSGTKQVLVDRIELFFYRTKNIIKIQSNYRRYIVIRSIALRGPALKNRKLCVNDTDFVSMEPLDEIPNEMFYSYKDEKGFIYGFNISSLIQILRNKSKFIS